MLPLLIRGTRVSNTTCNTGFCEFVFYSLHRYMPRYKSTIYPLTFAGLNFHRLPVFTIFTVCDIIAHPLPIWSKFLWDETFTDGY